MGAAQPADEAKEALSFETALEQLDTIVAALEEGRLTLDESLRLFERGVHLTQQCQEALDSAELRVQQLRVRTEYTGETEGESAYFLEPFDTDED